MSYIASTYNTIIHRNTLLSNATDAAPQCVPLDHANSYGHYLAKARPLELPVLYIHGVYIPNCPILGQIRQCAPRPLERFGMLEVHLPASAFSSQASLSIPLGFRPQVSCRRSCNSCEVLQFADSPRSHPGPWCSPKANLNMDTNWSRKQLDAVFSSLALYAFTPDAEYPTVAQAQFESPNASNYLACR